MKHPLLALPALSIALALSAAFQVQGQPVRGGDVTQPVADARAVVSMGRVRFTVLTPELIRMEWAEDGYFEDHASLVFLNRRLPVPRFEHVVTGANHTLTIKTEALSLAYTPGGDGRFTGDNLAITFTVDRVPLTWHPGLQDDANLLGTTRTLDGSLGAKTMEPMAVGHGATTWRAPGLVFLWLRTRLSPGLG